MAAPTPTPALEPAHTAPVAAPPPATPDTADTAVAPPRSDPRDTKKPPKRTDKKPDRKPSRSDLAQAAKPDRADKADDTEPAPAAKPDRRHSGHAVQDVKAEADTLYRAKNFSGAAAQITGALPSFSGAELQDLKTLAAVYTQLGKAYAIGMGPGTKPTEGIRYRADPREDRRSCDVGAAYTAEIDQHLATVATRAAASYMAAKEYESAYQAVRTSDAAGQHEPDQQIGAREPRRHGGGPVARGAERASARIPRTRGRRRSRCARAWWTRGARSTPRR